MIGLTIRVQEGNPDCIANEDGERQIACAISYAGEEVVRFAFSFHGTPKLTRYCTVHRKPSQATPREERAKHDCRFPELAREKVCLRSSL